MIRSRGGLANFTPIAGMGHLISEPKFKIYNPLPPPPPLLISDKSLILFHGSALFAVSICNNGSISSVLIFSLPADHSLQRNREEKAWRGLKTITKGSAYFQEKGWQLCEFSNFFLFERAKMIISVLVTWMTVDCNLAVRFLLSF